MASDIGVSYGDAMGMTLGELVEANVTLDLQTWYAKQEAKKHGG